jgi:hypothetical protein
MLPAVDPSLNLVDGFPHMRHRHLGDFSQVTESHIMASSKSSEMLNHEKWKMTSGMLNDVKWCKCM